MVDFDHSAAVWRKSTRSGGSGNNCVEVAFLRSFALVRDSHDPTGGVLTASRDVWQAFVHMISTGGV
jgi:hypothetical protein